MRWDQLGRFAMICVMVAIAYLYLSAGVSLFSTWRESKRDDAQVVSLQRENDLLQRQRSALSSPVQVEAQARKLGMIRPGEQGYVVSGLPPN